MQDRYAFPRLIDAKDTISKEFLGVTRNVVRLHDPLPARCSSLVPSVCLKHRSCLSPLLINAELPTSLHHRHPAPAALPAALLLAQPHSTPRLLSSPPPRRTQGSCCDPPASFHPRSHPLPRSLEHGLGCLRATRRCWHLG